MKIEGTPKEIADLLQLLQNQQFNEVCSNGTYSLGNCDFTFTNKLYSKEDIEKNGYAVGV